MQTPVITNARVFGRWLLLTGLIILEVALLYVTLRFGSTAISAYKWLREFRHNPLLVSMPVDLAEPSTVDIEFDRVSDKDPSRFVMRLNLEDPPDPTDEQGRATLRISEGGAYFMPDGDLFVPSEGSMQRHRLFGLNFKTTNIMFMEFPATVRAGRNRFVLKTHGEIPFLKGKRQRLWLHYNPVDSQIVQGFCGMIATCALVLATLHLFIILRFVRRIRLLSAG